MSHKFVPGDVVRFDYTDNKGLRTYDREVAVSEVKDVCGDTLVGGNDLSLADDEGQENYRQFYLSRMQNIEDIDPNYNLKKDQVVSKVSVVNKGQNDIFNIFMTALGYQPRPDDAKGALLWDLKLVMDNLDNLPGGSPSVELSITSSMEILKQVQENLEKLL